MATKSKNPQNNPSQPDLLDVIFANRNKEYGAYFLRKQYNRHLRNATFAGIVLFCLIVLAPSLQAYFGEEEMQTDIRAVFENVPSPPSIEEKTPPPPPPPPPPVEAPKAEVVKFVPPKVVQDDKVIEDDPPPKMEDMKNVEIGTEDQEGEKRTHEAIEELIIEEAPTAAEVVKVEQPKQPEPDPEDEAPKNEVFTFAEQMPEFPNGNIMSYLGSQIQYPEIARRAGIEGAVSIEFVISETGKVMNPKLIRGIGGGCDEEALRVVSAMPDWRPGKQNGNPVKVRQTVLVKFKLR